MNNSLDLVNIYFKGVYDFILYYLYILRLSIFSIRVFILIKGIRIFGEVCLNCENVYWDLVSFIGSFIVYLCIIFNIFYRLFIISYL